eukprot:TRINITY_DN10719_c0_g1_i2.p1 TRINITY_DN10719_c0_g1~~TRINITY_DN10719_c0_g1_i2.p1  ORF type:complete len:408 (-),score=50.17 TRINITY_DN10719_c0_g1_i2:104-1327(-)
MPMMFFVLLLITFSSAKTFSGYLTVNATLDANLFYYFIESSSSPSRDPLILWLQGGPGCSSLFGAFIENGPVLIQSNGAFKPNPYSWTAKANVLWIDSPVGTGFSYVSGDNYATNEKVIAQDLYNGLIIFLFEKFQNYSKSDFYIFGESYAGKYVPWLANTILSRNSHAQNIIQLKGVGIGDGWVNPYYQTGSYAPYLYRHGLIGSVSLAAADGVYLTYKGLWDVGAYTAAAIVGNDLLSGLMATAGLGDPYDIRKSSDPTDPLQDALATYLNLPATRKALGVGDRTWEACANNPYYYLLNDEARSSEDLVPQILAKIPVLFYNGDQDLICNMDGTHTLLSDINWNFQNQFNSAPGKNWSVAGVPAGTYKSFSTLTELVVFQAGHMVPYDQPKNAQDLAYRFISGGF